MSTFSAFANRIIKVTREDETRRGHLSIAPTASASEAFSAIESAVGALFEILPVPLVGYRITYPDGDGDLCTLTQNTVSDFAVHAPEGVLRLTLTKISTSDNDGSVASPMEVELDASGASRSDHTSPDSDAAIRATLKRLAEKIPPPMRPFVLNMLQGMDPAALHNLLEHALPHVQQEQDNLSQETAKVLQTLRGMEPSAVHALVLDVLRSSVDTSAGGSTTADASNPLEAMLGAFLGGKGFGKGCGGQGYDGACPPPNPMDFLGPILAGKGCGKQGSQPQNPLDFLGPLLSGKGCGKGNRSQPPNPFDVLGPLLAGKGFGKGGGMDAPMPQAAANDGQPPNPMQALFQTLLASKGAGKGFVAPATAQAEETTASVPPATASTATTCDGASAEVDTARAAFEESVNDLLNMGLVTDRQTARELLTQHGDISSVVALLADSEA